MKINNFNLFPARVLLVLVLFFLWQYAKAQEYSLNNELIHVSFGGQGIRSLTDKRLNKTFTFTSDRFLVSLNGKMADSALTTSEGVTASPDKIIYSYKVTDFTIRVIYTLEKLGFFISKHLEIYPDKDESFKVDRLRIWDIQPGEKLSSYYVPRTKRPNLKTGDYGAFVRFSDATGFVMTVQNPFLSFKINREMLSLEYQPEMNWKKEYGPFKSDIGNIGAYALTGNRVPAKLVPEWKWTNGVIGITDEEQDEAEVEAFTKIVSQYVLPHLKTSVKMNVGWCENDYQIDISKPAGRSEYKRIIDQTAAMGMDHVLFTPSNAALGSREEATDDWGWENLLWLGLGIKIRKGEWDVDKDPVPESVLEMLDYAKSKKVKLISYLYPVLPFAGNPEWIVEGSPYHQKKKHASLGVRSFQDYLIRALGRFYERTGISGYSYDYTYLWYEGTSRYEQWWGWCRVKESLRKKYPEMIIDGRQLDQLYGPWSWLSNTFPHPTAEDEQPESFIPFPDLHFDRVSANRQRYTAYRYRVNDYCPPAIMPGFMFHQTSRNDVRDGKVVLALEGFRRRDWDYLGWKYSLFSSIGTGGLNNVVNMIPARDPEEMRYFSEADKKFVRDWLTWTDKNREYLLETKFILGQPAFGKVDGTTAIKGNRGYIFLFNPNARRLKAEFFLDASIGITKAGNFQVSMLYPQEGLQVGPQGNSAHWQHGNLFSLDMDGASVVLLSIAPAPEKAAEPTLFNVSGKARLAGNSLHLDQVVGEMGRSVSWKAGLPEGKKVKKVFINGKQAEFIQTGKSVTGMLTFEGKSFSPMQQVGEFDPLSTGRAFSGSFTIPQWIVEQLKQRKKDWPIPWSKDDYHTTWLAPERLLLFVQIAEPEDTMQVEMRLNGKKVELIKAYSTVRPNRGSLVGWYCDISNLAPETLHAVDLSLPVLRPGQFQGLFFENIEKKYTSTFTVQ
ncbi:MAG: hypothetical protein WKF97_19810 [Chitinophagaceae bacterium]